MDNQFLPIKAAAYAGDFELFKTLLKADRELITGVSKDPGDSPNVIQFVIVDGGLGKIPEPVKYLQFLIDNGSTTEKQLVAAASIGSRELIDTLIEAGVSVEDGAPWTAIEEALYWDHPEIADYLINEHDGKVKTLVAAAMIGDIDRLKTFFEEGHLVNSVLPIHFPWGPIAESTAPDALNQGAFLGLRCGQYETAGFLIEQGARINDIAAGHHEQCTPLHQAANRGDRKMVDWLLERGARLDVKDPRFDGDPAGWANQAGHTALAAYLEEQKGK